MSIVFPDSPDLTVPCDGFSYDEHCITGTIVYFVDGIPRTQQLFGERAEPQAWAEQAPYAPPIVDRVVTPEPAYLGLMLAILGAMAWRVICSRLRGEKRS